MTDQSIIPIDDRGFVYDNYGTLESICKKVLDSGITKLGNIQQIALVIVKGRSLGLDLFDSLENIHVIDNKTTLSGDLAMALVERSGLFEDKSHLFEGDGMERKCTVTVIRKGRTPKSWTFSIQEAKIAGLLDKRGGSWTKFPDSMLYYRALGFALRREFPDVLRGMHLTEEFDQLPDEQPVQILKAKVTEPAPNPIIQTEQRDTSAPGPQKDPSNYGMQQASPVEKFLAFAAERGYSRDQMNDVVRKLKQANSIEELTPAKIDLLIKHWSSIDKEMSK